MATVPPAELHARILLVEDEVNMARTLAKNLERAGYHVEHAPHGEAALERLAAARFDIVVTDLKMPVMDGMQLLRAMHERQACAPAVVVLTGYGTIESAVEAMKLGAADYLIKDARPQEILLDDRARAEPRRAPSARTRGCAREVGQLARLRRAHRPERRRCTTIYRVIEAVKREQEHRAASAARAAPARSSSRAPSTSAARSRDAPFVAVNCAGLSETLLDSQLFGHRRGAFTGAVSDHDGVFRAADGRHAVPRRGRPRSRSSLQAKFLRAIQEREVTPLGSSLPVPVDVRLIAATNRDLDGRGAGRPLPRRPLLSPERRAHRAAAAARRGRDDIPLLVDHFVRALSAGSTASRRSAIAPDALARAAGVRLAGQHPRAAERHRAGVRALDAPT